MYPNAAAIFAKWRVQEVLGLVGRHPIGGVQFVKDANVIGLPRFERESWQT